MIPPPPTSTLFPYTTLFRSEDRSLLLRAPFVALRYARLHDAHANALNCRIWAAREPPKAKCIEKSQRHQGYRDRKSTRLNSSHMSISYAVFCLKKKKKNKKK